jgi:hypothetical protein
MDTDEEAGMPLRGVHMQRTERRALPAEVSFPP